MAKAFALGDPLVKVHPQTGRNVFLKLHFEFSEMLEESWQTLRRELSDGMIGEPEPEVTEPIDNIDTADALKGNGKQAKGKAKPAPKGKPEKTKDKETIKFEECWVAALKSRKLLLATIAQSSEISHQIESSEQWCWARNEQNQGTLNNMMANLRTSMSDFHKSFIAEEPSTIRKRHTRELIMGEMKTFGELHAKVIAIGDFVKVLQRRNTS